MEVEAKGHPMTPDNATAWKNYHALQRAPYPGRGIIVGLDEKGDHLIQMYWVMGRSEGSRNRHLVRSRKDLLVEPIDPSKVDRPELTVYRAMATYDGVHVVSNGAQTDAIIEGLRCGLPMTVTLDEEGWSYEPDSPHFTPRISATVRVKPELSVVMSVLSKDALSDNRQHAMFLFKKEQLAPGFGWCITTYEGEDTDPLPSFRGRPRLVPLPGPRAYLLETLYWKEGLNKENRVGIAMKVINVQTGLSHTFRINAREPRMRLP